MKFDFSCLVVALAAIVASCTTKVEVVQVENIIEVEVHKDVYPTIPPADTLHPNRAVLAYYGPYEGEYITVDRFYLSLFSDDYELTLCLHTETKNQDISYVCRGYEAPGTGFDLYPGQYETGYEHGYDDPYEGTKYFCLGSYFIDYKDGNSHDLLQDGVFTVEDLGNGTYKVYGVMVGSKFTKRYFDYVGPIERSEYEYPVPKNSTITEDVTITKEVLPNIAIIDGGHPFGPFMTDNACRAYNVFLYDDGVEMGLSRPTGGQGAVMLLALYVNWEADGTIPAGDYTLVSRLANNGIYREDAVPFRFVAGYPNRYSDPQGCWYYHKNGNYWADGYAMVTGGSLNISYDTDGTLHIVGDLTDCSNPSKYIRISW